MESVAVFTFVPSYTIAMDLNLGSHSVVRVIIRGNRIRTGAQFVAEIMGKVK